MYTQTECFIFSYFNKHKIKETREYEKPHYNVENYNLLLYRQIEHRKIMKTKTCRIYTQHTHT